MVHAGRFAKGAELLICLLLVKTDDSTCIIDGISDSTLDNSRHADHVGKNPLWYRVLTAPLRKELLDLSDIVFYPATAGF